MRGVACEHCFTKEILRIFNSGGHLRGNLASVSLLPSDLFAPSLDRREVALDVEVSLSEEFERAL